MSLEEEEAVYDNLLKQKKFHACVYYDPTLKGEKSGWECTKRPVGKKEAVDFFVSNNTDCSCTEKRLFSPTFYKKLQTGFYIAKQQSNFHRKLEDLPNYDFEEN